MKRRSEKRRITEWAAQHAKVASAEAGISIPIDLAASCYPLHPLAVEALPELCSRYGQNDRTLLSFVFGGGPGTVARSSNSRGGTGAARCPPWALTASTTTLWPDPRQHGQEPPTHPDWSR